MHRLRLIRGIALALGLALIVFASAACSDDAIEAERAVIPPTPRPAAPIPGEMVDDGFAPTIDDEVAVVGVAIGGYLPMRVFPGIDQNVVAEIPPTADDIYGFGETFETDDGRQWWMVRWENSQGWIEPGAAYLGSPQDISVTVAGTLPASVFASNAELVDAVLAQFPPNPIIVDQTVDTANGTSTTLVDLMAQSESQLGRRLVIDTAGSGSEWRLTGVAEVPLCRRGLSPEGACT